MSSVQFSRSLLDALGLKASDTFTYEILVRLLRAIEARLKPLEDQSGSLEAAIEAVRKVGLDRINEVLVPAIQLVFEIQSKGFLVARSSSSVTLADGNVLTLIVGEEQGRALFTPGPFTALTREANADDYAIARTIDYNQTSGVYTCQVLSFEGAAGPHSDWVIGALAASTIAGMTLRDQTLAARDAASGYATAADTARGLAVTAKGAAEAAAGVAGGHASAADTSRGEALGFRNQAEAFATAAATFDPSNFYTKGVVDAAFAGEATARGVAISTAVLNVAKTNVAQQFTKPQRASATAIPSGTTMTADLAANNDFTVAAYAHTGTLANPTNQATQINQKGSITITQDGSGGHPLAFASNWKPFGQSTAPSINTTAGVTSVIDYHVISASVIRYTLRAIGA